MFPWSVEADKMDCERALPVTSCWLPEKVPAGGKPAGIAGEDWSALLVIRYSRGIRPSEVEVDA